MPRLLIRDEADADIDAIAHFIAGDNIDAGRGFCDAVLHDLQLLAAMPRIGAKRYSRHPPAGEPPIVAGGTVSELSDLLPRARRRNRRLTHSPRRKRR